MLVSGGDQDEDLVADGWTDIFRNLTGIAAKTASRQLGRRLTSREKGQLMELSDYQKMNQVRSRVDEIVDDPATAAALKPWYRQFCKRPCFHDEYLPTFNRPNVTLVDTDGKGVERITATGIVANGEHYEVDCIIFATGFEVGTSYTRRAGYDIVGRNGETLSDRWANGLRTMHGLFAHGFPNCFFLGFTQTAVTVNVPHALNEQAKHVRYVLERAREQGASTIEVTAEAEQAWVDEVRDKARLGARFYAECTPGYYNAVIAEYVYATNVPENAATAAAHRVIAEAKIVVEGTPTPLPWNAIIITSIPPTSTALPTPVPLIISESLFTPTPTPTELPPEELPPELSNKIIFKSNRSGREQTYIMDPETGAVSLITQNWLHPLAERLKIYSPDRARKALVIEDINHFYQIHVKWVEYGSVHQITTHDGISYDPAWSPRGDLIAFTSTDPGNDEIFVVDPEGNSNTLRQLTHNDFEWDKHPTWSPDGTQIVWYSNRYSSRRQLWIMNLDGSGLRNLSNNEYEDWDPVWIP